MSNPVVLELDSRRAGDVAAELAVRRGGYVPEWTPADVGPGAALGEIFARYVETIVDRLNQAPEKSKLAFLDQLGLDVIPARAARAPLVFRLAEKAPATTLPAGAQAAAPPAGAGGPIVFETEQSVGLTPGKIVEVVSLWPGRDQYVDHTAALAAGQAFRTFDRALLVNTPHELYIAHDVLLALSGQAMVSVEFELSQFSDERLPSVWEYWDGAAWRPFLHQRPACSGADEKVYDGTAGLTRNGRILLEAESAESARRDVNGVAGYWIRGRLDQPLPVDPRRILPEVAQVRLATVIERNPKILQVKSQYVPGDVLLRCDVRDANGLQFDNAELHLTVILPDASASQMTIPLAPPEDKDADQTPVAALPRAGLGPLPFVLHVKIPSSRDQGAPDFRFSHEFTYAPRDAGRPTLDLTLTLSMGEHPDAAFANAEKIKLSEPFYPFGQQPQPGSTFYFTAEEAFTKPGARLAAYVAVTATPQDVVGIETEKSTGHGRVTERAKSLEHRVAWEYWNGREWSILNVVTNDVGQLPEDFTGSGAIQFVVPDDMAVVSVNDQEGRWMRARLVSGGYGFTKEITWRDAREVKDVNTFTYVVAQPPALADFRLSYSWEHGPFYADRVLAANDFRYVDHTDAARWPGASFQPFTPVADLLPALYLGHDKPLPVDRVNLYFDLLEAPELAAGPNLIWEYWDGFQWMRVLVEDETDGLSHGGMASLVGPNDAALLPRFGGALYWLRARLSEDAPPPEAFARGVYLNAVWAAQQQTVVEESLGVSNGLPSQSFRVRQPPILDDEWIEVRERVGQRANVEWRILALAALDGNRQALTELERQLGAEGTETDVVRGPLRLRRDRRKNVAEVWLRWTPQLHVLESQPGDRHYVPSRPQGLLHFGDGVHGMTPPLGAEIRARRYRSGGGAAGNVATGAIKQLLAGAAGVESVANPVPAEGGADAETLSAFSRRGPRTLRRRGRGATAADYETLALEASSAVAVAHVLPTRDFQNRPRPGWVTVVIIPRSDEPRPWPSPGMRDHVRRFIEQRISADVAGLEQVFVTGPDYLPIDVEAAIAAVDVTQSGVVERAARGAIEHFLHPLRGGPQGMGWPAGRDVCVSDLAAVLESVAGLDYARELVLLIAGEPRGETVAVPAGKVVVAGEIRIKVLIS